MLVVHSVMLVILFAFLRYSFFGGLTHSSFFLRWWSLGREISLDPSWIATRLMIFCGVGRPTFVHTARRSAVFHPVVIIQAATLREIFIGADSSSLMWALLKISRP